MLPKTGSRSPKAYETLSEAAFAVAIGRALQSELGASRRATKTIMGWANVSDRTARMWLHGERCPNAASLVALLVGSPAVLKLVLTLAGHDQLGLAADLIGIETNLETALKAVRELRANQNQGAQL